MHADYILTTLEYQDSLTFLHFFVSFSRTTIRMLGAFSACANKQGGVTERSGGSS